MNILEFLDSPELIGGGFDGDTRQTMRSVLAAAWGQPLDPVQRERFDSVAGGREPPTERARELWIIAGRRSEKTRTAAAIALHAATVGALDALHALKPGERALVAVVAVDRQQARSCMSYLRALIEQSPVLSPMVDKVGAETVELNNGVEISIMTRSFRSIRSTTLLALILDEVAFFHDETTANPDREIYRAAVPALATTNGMVIGISSPYAARGLLYEKYRRHYGKGGDVLVVQGGTRDFNPTIPESLIQDALKDDPEGARAEWLGMFRNDVASFISREVVEGCVIPGRHELPPTAAFKYQAFVDPSGGSRDSFTLAIGHREDSTVVVDAIREVKPPFSPESVAQEFSGLLKSYRVTKVVGDRYAGEWPREQFRKAGVTYDPAAAPRSDLYRDLLPVLNSGRIELLDNEKLIHQLAALERRTARSGKDTIDHGPGGHDDVANAVAGLSSLLSRRQNSYSLKHIFDGDAPTFPHPITQFV